MKVTIELDTSNLDDFEALQRMFSRTRNVTFTKTPSIGPQKTLFDIASENEQLPPYPPAETIAEENVSDVPVEEVKKQRIVVRKEMNKASDELADAAGVPRKKMTKEERAAAASKVRWEKERERKKLGIEKPPAAPKKAKPAAKKKPVSKKKKPMDDFSSAEEQKLNSFEEIDTRKILEGVE